MRALILLAITAFIGAIYFGIGFIFHTLLIGHIIDYSSTYSLGVILGWPILAFLAFLIIASVFCVLFYVLFKISDIRTARAARKRHADLDHQMDEMRFIKNFIFIGKPYYVVGKVDIETAHGKQTLTSGTKIIKTRDSCTNGDRKYWFTAPSEDGRMSDAFSINREDIKKLSTQPLPL